MIINYDFYYCNTCKKAMHFDTSKPYSKICPECNQELQFKFNGNGDTERAERVKKQPKYDPTADPNSPFYRPKINCRYCNSTNVKKITAGDRAVSYAFFGLFSNKRGKQ